MTRRRRQRGDRGGGAGVGSSTSRRTRSRRTTAPLAELEAEAAADFYAAVETVEEAEEPAALEFSADSLQLFLKDVGKVEPADRCAGGRAREAHRARRPSREAGDGRGEPAPRRLDREALPQPGPAVPRPDPGGDDRPRARRREVRLAQGLQVLDVRDLVDPPGGRAGARRQGAHDPHAGARRREAEQDHAHRAQAARRAGPRADDRGDRARPRHDASRRSSRSAAPRRRRSRSRSRSATRRSRSSGSSSRTSTTPLPDEAADTAFRAEALTTLPGVAQLPRAPRARAALRAERRAAVHARRGRPRVRGHARAHPPDREPGR